MRNATLCFLVKESHGKINQLCLAMKKRGFGAGRWNGVGGKVESETIEQAMLREAYEEICVRVQEYRKIAELDFAFPHNIAWNQRVHVYLATKWDGKPQETDEMSPQWFAVGEIPYDHMWPDDRFWLPQALAGRFVRASFTFGPEDRIMEQNVITEPGNP